MEYWNAGIVAKGTIPPSSLALQSHRLEERDPSVDGTSHEKVAIDYWILFFC